MLTKLQTHADGAVLAYVHNKTPLFFELDKDRIQRSDLSSGRLIELRRLRTTNQFQYVFVMDLGGALDLNCLIQERGSIFPTVYALWRHPELLPSFPT